MYTHKSIFNCTIVMMILMAGCMDTAPGDSVRLAQVPIRSKTAKFQNEKGQTLATTKLDSIRIRMKNEYARVHPELVRPLPDEIKPTPPAPQQTSCKSCDIQFLARISKQGEISRDDYIYLLCTLDKSCENNAEFLEFYNEELFRHVTRQPQQFLETFMRDSSKWDLLAFELAHPVSDAYSREAIMEILISTNNQFDQKFRQPMNILQQRMKGMQ